MSKHDNTRLAEAIFGPDSPEAKRVRLTEQPATHTPGPWTSTVSPFGQVEVRGDEGAFVCRLRHMDGEFDTTILTEQNKANARLIAAAPELLEALKAVAAALESALVGKRDIILTPEDALAEARAAIAKATGGAQ